MELIVGARRVTPVSIHPIKGGIQAELRGEGLLRLLDATFHSCGTIEVLGGEWDRRPMEVTDIAMSGATTKVTLICKGPAPRLV